MVIFLTGRTSSFIHLGRAARQIDGLSLGWQPPGRPPWPALHLPRWVLPALPGQQPRPPEICPAHQGRKRQPARVDLLLRVSLKPPCLSLPQARGLPTTCLQPQLVGDSQGPVRHTHMGSGLPCQGGPRPSPTFQAVVSQGNQGQARHAPCCRVGNSDDPAFPITGLRASARKCSPAH